jgi:hypothetical protein
VECTLKTVNRIAARYVPEGAMKHAHEDAGAVVYYFRDRRGKPSAIAYAGTAYRPAFHHCYADEAKREQHVSRWLEVQRAKCANRMERQQERKAATHTLVVGDVVWSSWGYEQTNVAFYQVVRVVSAKSVEVRQISQETTEDGFMSGRTIGLKDQFLKGALGLVRRAEGDRVMCIDRSRHSASKWDGKPQFCSWYA